MSAEDELSGLMASYQAGRLEAFERLYALVAPELERYFRARVGEAAPDLVQETFLEIHRARHTYTPPLPVRPWIFGVGRNVERRYWRRHHRRREGRQVELDVAERATADAGSHAPTWPELRDAVRRLPSCGRDEWLLHHIEGWSFPEIGTRLRIEAGAARLRAHRTMEALRELLGIERRKRDE